VSGRKSKQRGKSFELNVADYLGMKKAHYKAHDLEGHPLITVECKKRERLPASIKGWCAQAAAAVEPKKVPVVVAGELYGLTKDALVILRLEDFKFLLRLADQCEQL